jgi:hypothetical protein
LPFGTLFRVKGGILKAGKKPHEEGFRKEANKQKLDLIFFQKQLPNFVEIICGNTERYLLA